MIDSEVELEDYLDETVEYEDVFLRRSEQIYKALTSLSTDIRSARESEMIRALNIALSGTEKDDGNLTDAFIGYIQLIIRRDKNAANKLRDRGASEEFVEFVLNSILEFGPELQRHNFRQTQGDNWWSFIDTDVILKESGIRHQHILEIDRSEKVEIDSVPYSDWVLIRHFLETLLESYGATDDGDLGMIDSNEFNRVRQLIYALEEDIKEQGVELPAKEELLSEDTPSNEDE